MIISIDQSPLWRAQRAGKEELSQLQEALFRSGRGRRPASGLEVVFLADALGCPEEAIAQHSAPPRKPKAPAGDSVSTRATPGGSSTEPLLMQPRFSDPIPRPSPLERPTG